MKRFDLQIDCEDEPANGSMHACQNGDYILFTDHEADKAAAIKKAVEDEREAITALIDVTPYAGCESLNDFEERVLEAIRQRSTQN